MPEGCCAAGCRNRRDRETHLAFYRIPKEQSRRDQWMVAIQGGRKDFIPTKHARLCSQHFVSGEKSDHPYSPDYVPSVFSHTTEEEKRKGIEALAAFEARRKKPRVQAEQDVAESSLLSAEEVDAEEECQAEDEGLQDGLGKAMQTELSEGESFEVTTDFNILRKRLKQPKIFSFDIDSFTNGDIGDEKVRYFTGLPSLSVLKAVLNFLEPCICKNKTLSPFQQLLLVLMRLRLNLDIEFLGMCFGLSQQSVDKLFLEVIDVCYNRLVPALIIWPMRKQIRLTLPSVFHESYDKCVCIIDCFEILIEKPENHKAYEQTYSSTKNHNTLKYFTAITPQGTVSFVSKGWGGCTTDKFITENSSFLDHILPEDLVLANRDFDVKDSIAVKGGRLEILASPNSKEKGHLVSSDSDSDNEEAAPVRAHMETVIERVRKEYSILGSTIPISLLMTQDSRGTSLDKIVHVCCALTNICKALVPPQKVQYFQRKCSISKDKCAE